MTQTEIQNYHTYKSDEEGVPKQLVIMLHGLGANGQDLIGLAQYLVKSAPDAVFVSPDAPFPCDMAPIGYQWFSLQERSHEALISGISLASPILDKFIDEQLEKYGLSDQDLVLLGFSQGTMMSLYTGPRRAEKIGGILGYSGALVWEENYQIDQLQKPPVYLIHGDTDDVVPVEAYHHAQQTLEKAGFEVGGEVSSGLGHGIDEAGIARGADFLKESLS